MGGAVMATWVTLSVTKQPTVFARSDDTLD